MVCDGEDYHPFFTQNPVKHCIVKSAVNHNSHTSSDKMYTYTQYGLMSLYNGSNRNYTS